MRAIILLLLSLGHLAGANYYVLREATGTRDGSDWVNADTNIPVVQPVGATFIVGRGHYAPLTWTNDGGSVIKATTNAHGTSTGWSDAFAQTAHFTNSVYITANNFTFDGVTGGGPSKWNNAGRWTNAFGSWTNWQGSWTQAFGFVIRGTAGGQGWLQCVDVTNTYLRHFEVFGPGDQGDLGSHTPGLIWQYATNTGAYDWYVHHISGPIINSRAREWSIGNFWTGYYESTDPNGHAEVMSIANQNAGGTVTNLWITNGVIYYVEGTGGIVANADSLTIANVIFGFVVEGQAYINGWTGNWAGGSSQVTNWKIHNNLFHGGLTLIYFAGTTIVGGNVFSNNLVYAAYLGPWSANGSPAHDYNTYGDISGSSFEGKTGAEAEAHTELNWVAGNFVYNVPAEGRLAVNTTAGVDTAFDYDILGYPRTTQSRGPFEYMTYPDYSTNATQQNALSMSGRVTMGGRVVFGR